MGSLLLDYIHKICDGAGGVVAWRLRHRGGLGTGLPVFCGELVLEIFQICCGDVVLQVVPGQVCVYDAVGGRDGSLAVGGAVVDLLLGAGGSGDDGAGWGFGSFGLPLNLRHRRRAVSGPLRPVRTGHALLCHKNHLFPRMFPGAGIIQGCNSVKSCGKKWTDRS